LLLLPNFFFQIKIRLGQFTFRRPSTPDRTPLNTGRFLSTGPKITALNSSSSPINALVYRLSRSFFPEFGPEPIATLLFSASRRFSLQLSPPHFASRFTENPDHSLLSEKNVDGSKLSVACPKGSAVRFSPLPLFFHNVSCEIFLAKIFFSS